MTDDELGRSLSDAAGDPGSRPEVEGLWRAGRSRRTRATALRLGAAAVVVVALGAAVLVVRAGDDGDEVRAGPPDTVAPAPPAEPDLPVRLVVTSPIGDFPDGTPGLYAGQIFAARHESTDDAGWIRGVGAEWEHWTPEGGWELTHLMSVSLGEDAPVVVPEAEAGNLAWPDIGISAGADTTFATPEPAAPGWYRLCTSVVRDATDESESFEDRQERVCDQLRIIESDDEIYPRPPAEPEGPVRMTLTSPAGFFADGTASVLPGGDFTIHTDADDPEAWVGTYVYDWEAYDPAAGWSTTHALTVSAGDIPGPSVEPSDGSPTTVAAIGVPLGDHPAVAPERLGPGWYRVCSGFVGSAGGDPEVRACAQLRVIPVKDAGETTPMEPGGTTTPPSTATTQPADEGAPATWTVDPDDPPDGGTTFTALVTGIDCAGGQAMPVRDTVIGEDGAKVTITFTVASPEGPATCQGNPATAVPVTLPSPLGGRIMVDGACLAPPAQGTGPCTQHGGVIRWPLILDIELADSEPVAPGGQVVASISPDPALRTQDIVGCPSLQFATAQGSWDPPEPVSPPTMNCGNPPEAKALTWTVPADAPAGPALLCVEIVAREGRPPPEPTWACVEFTVAD